MTGQHWELWVTDRLSSSHAVVTYPLYHIVSVLYSAVQACSMNQFAICPMWQWMWVGSWNLVGQWSTGSGNIVVFCDYGKHSDLLTLWMMRLCRCRDTQWSGWDKWQHIATYASYIQGDPIKTTQFWKFVTRVYDDAERWSMYETVQYFI